MEANHNHLEPLFQPIRINQMELENRIVMPAMHTMFANADGSVSRRLTAYHAERAEGGVGLQILENSAIEWRRGRANGSPARIDANEYVAGLHDLTEAVHAVGGKIATQPHHSGRQNPRVNTVDLVGTVAPSPIACRVNLGQPEELSAAAIEELIEMFAEAVQRSRSAGFDAVEIHAAHGYLIHQFASPYTNKRRDGWGGSAENRFRFAREVIAACRATVGPDFPILVRVSGEDSLPGGLVLEEATELAVELQEAGADAFHVSAGMHESMDKMMIMHGVPPGALLSLAAAVKQAVDVPVVAVGRLGHDPDLAARAIADGLTDMVAFGRTLIAEPRLPRLLREGRRREARPCIACNTCVGELFNQRRMHCVVNPESGQEALRASHPAELHGRRVMIVGGGPAGLEAAARFAAAGAAVTLTEAEAELGGQLRAAAQPAHKRPEFPQLLEFFIRSAERFDVDVQLGTRVDVENVQPGDLDLVLLANGGVPVGGPSLPGRATFVAAELLTRGIPPEGSAAFVLGATQVGLDTALWLREHGIAVTVIEEGEEAAADVNLLLRDHLLRLAGEAGVEVRLGTSLEEVDDGETTLVSADLRPARYGRELPEGVVAIGAAALPAANLHGATASALRALNHFAAQPRRERHSAVWE